jgi:hypothetical protein
MRFLCRADSLKHNINQALRVSKLGLCTLCQSQSQHREMIFSECRSSRTIIRELLYLLRNSQINENYAHLIFKVFSIRKKARIVKTTAVLSILSVSRNWILIFQFRQDLMFIVCSRRDHLHVVKWIKKFLTLRRRIVNTHALSILNLCSRLLKETVSELNILFTVISVRLNQLLHRSQYLLISLSTFSLIRHLISHQQWCRCCQMHKSLRCSH